jgi:hypothetical protein
VTASFSLIGTEEAAVKALKERRRSSMGNKKDGEVSWLAERDGEDKHRMRRTSAHTQSTRPPRSLKEVQGKRQVWRMSDVLKIGLEAASDMSSCGLLGAVVVTLTGGQGRDGEEGGGRQDGASATATDTGANATSGSGGKQEGGAEAGETRRFCV